MFNKFLATFLMCAASGVVYANGATYIPPQNLNSPAGISPTETGFYIGASIDRDRGKFSSNYAYSAVHTANGGSISVPVALSGSSNLGGTGLGGEIFLGYATTFMQRGYLALEAFGDLTTNRSKVNQAAVAFTDDGSAGSFSNSLQLRQKWSAGVSLIPGMKVTPDLLLFGRVGWIMSKFNLNGSMGSSIQSGDPSIVYSNPNLSVPLNQKQRLNGLQLGLGAEYMVTKQVGIRGEWDWSYFQHFKAGSSVTGASASFNVGHPVVDQFKLGAVYHFTLA